MPDDKKRSVASQLEGKAAYPFGSDDQYWDGVIQSAQDEDVDDSSTPNIDGDKMSMNSFNRFCVKNGISDPAVALQLIDMITDNFEKDTLKQERLRKEQEEAPIDEAMSLQGKNVYTFDDKNPAQEAARDEADWGRKIREGQEDERSSDKPVIASAPPVEFRPPLNTRERIFKATDFYSNPDNLTKFSPAFKKSLWRGISNAAKNIGVSHPVISKFRVMYDLEPVPNYERVYSLSIPLWRVQVKSAVKCKDPENCVDPAHDHQYYVEGFVTTPMKDLQGEVVKETVFPEIVNNIAKAPHNLGWLHHESPYANPEAAKAEPAIMFEEARVERNPIGKLGVWVRGKLNKMHPAFKQSWYELKEGFLNAFSMEFMPLNETQGYVDGKATNIVDQIKYLSTSLVRAPANEGAYITKVYAKSYAGLGHSSWSRSSRQPPTGYDNQTKRKGEVKKISSKDLGRETGTTAPERSNTAIGEWGDSTLEKGQAKLHDAQERASALERLKPKDTPFSPRPRRAIGTAGKAVPSHDPSQVDPEADQARSPHHARIAESTQEPEDYKQGVVKREEEEEDGGFSYQPSEDAPGVESDPTKFEEDERREEEEAPRREEDEEERRMEEAYKTVLRKGTPKKRALQEKALNWLAKRYPNMPLAQARKAAGEMTEVLGEVNAPQKIDKEQVPPEVDYGKYGSPDMPAPLATFGAQITDIATKAVAAKLSEFTENMKREILPLKRATVREKGYGAENTVRDKNVEGAAEQPDVDPWSIEGQLAQQIVRQGVR